MLKPPQIFIFPQRKTAIQMDYRSLFYSIIIIFFFFFLSPILQVAESAAAAADESFCGAQVCGNVIISFPFGIEPGCYFDDWFKVTCNQTSDGPKPYINRLGLEILSVPSSGTVVVVNNPVTYFNCIDRGRTGTVSVNLKGTPFYFSGGQLGSVGCGNLATVSLISNRTDSPVGCVQQTCGGVQVVAKSGCVTDAFEGTFFSYTLNMTPIHSFASFATADRDGKRCSSAFVFDSLYYSDGDNLLPRDINIESTHVAATLSWDSAPICVSGDPLCQGPAALVPKSNDKETCGSRKANIQYPFGINSYMNDWFRVTCNETDNGPMPYMHSIKLQLLEVSFWEGTVLVNHPIAYFSCGKNRDERASVNLTGSPFYFSEADNVFWSTGCGHVAAISGNQTDHIIGGCLQPRCKTNNKISNNAGCHIKIPLLRLITSFSANMAKFDISNSSKSKTSSCGFASLVNENFYTNWNSDQPISNLTHVPITLQWATPISGLCQLKDDFNSSSCSSDGQYCWQSLSSTHLCVCSTNDGGLSTDVCEEGKCKDDTKYRYCQMLCLNSSADYCSSMGCPLGFEYNSTSYRCEPLKTSSPVSTENIRNLAIIIGCTTIGTILFMLGTLRMYNVLKRRQSIKMKKKYFKRNGGLLLQQHLSSNNGNIKKIKLFSSKKMEKATNNYNENRILGQGGQGTVYKGMLTDGSIVAIKKSKMVEGKKKLDARKVEQFINEVIILSQINHRNVVNLLGCCLEAEVPLLVYEFIPNGTLYDLIHCKNEEFPLTWKLRLRIAVEIANALFYLHSSASVPIYHRDIKSSNILLDDKYSAKVSDFGTSRSIALEQTHLTTRVQGTFGYMDPEYFRSSQFTEKSDVYSFGVVLVELLTGEKPICSKETEEVRSLVSCFLLSMQENTLSDMLDSMILDDGPENEIISVAKLAKRCLNLNGKKRPTMKQVATELELIKSSKEYEAVEESGDEESETDDIFESWDVDSSSTTSRLVATDSVTLPLTSSF